MPNWCENYITVYSKNKDNVIDFRRKLSDWTCTPNLDKDAWGGSSNWLGHLLICCGFNEEDVCTGKIGRCRGEIIDFTRNDSLIDTYELDDGTFYGIYIETQTAWEPHVKMWRKMLDYLYPNDDFRIAFGAEETGMEMFVYCDVDGVTSFEGSYYVDIETFDEEFIEKFPKLAKKDFYFEDKNSVLEIINAILPTEKQLTVEQADKEYLFIEAIEEAENIVRELEDNYCNICKFESCDFDDFN